MRAQGHLKLIVCAPRSPVEPSPPNGTASESDRVSMIHPVGTRSAQEGAKARAAMLVVCLVSALLLCLAFKP